MFFDPHAVHVCFSQNPWIKLSARLFSNWQAVALYVWFRRRCCKLPVNYTPVNHGLDEEEMAFKRTMETQHGDDIDEVNNAPHEWTCCNTIRLMCGIKTLEFQGNLRVLHNSGKNKYSAKKKEKKGSGFDSGSKFGCGVWRFPPIPPCIMNFCRNAQGRG